MLENNSATTDSNGVARNSLNVIVEGGESGEIAEIIYQNKGAGVGLQGSTLVNLQRNGQIRPIRFDRATPVDIAVSMRLVRYEDFTEIDQAEIRRLLAALRFEIGKPVSLSRLYSPINQVGGFWVQSLTIGRRGQNLRGENVAISPREMARILSENIQIEVQ